jgi:hypothetical protein
LKVSKHIAHACIDQHMHFLNAFASPGLIRNAALNEVLLYLAGVAGIPARLRFAKAGPANGGEFHVMMTPSARSLPYT